MFSTIAILLTILIAPNFCQSQVIIGSFEPAEITVCGDNISYQIEVMNDGLDVISNSTLSIRFPLGIQYVAGSIVGNGVNESDISDQGFPFFEVDNISPGNSVSFQITIKASCSSLDITSSFSNRYNLLYAGNSEIYESAPYNILIPSISISSVSNEDYLGAVRDTFIRSFTISNRGFGEIDSLFFSDVFPVGLSMLSVSPGSNNITGNKTQNWLTAADFRMIGDGDDLFEFGEEITIEEKIEIIGCEIGTSRISINWGCDGNFCKEFLFFAQVSIGDEPPVLEASYNQVQYADFCNEGVFNMVVANTAPIAANSKTGAFNIVLEPGLGDTKPQTITQNACYFITGLNINGVDLILDTLNYNGYGFDLSELTTDPDGPGGLADLDGDGQFDDLPAGEEFNFQFFTKFDIGCLDCQDASLPQTPIRLAQNYSNECGAYFYEIENSDRYKQRINAATVEDNLQFEYLSGDTVQLNFSFSRTASTFLNSCSDPQVTISLNIPKAFTFTDFITPTFEGLPVNYSLNNDVLNIDYSGFPTGELALYFIINCDPSLLGQDQPCQVIENPPESNIFEYRVNFSCPSSGCNDSITLFCGSTTPSFAYCQTDLRATDFIDILDFKATRTTLGWADTTLTSFVNPDDPKIDLTTGTSYDIVKFDVIGVATGMGNFNSAKLRIFHSPIGSNPLFSYLREEVELYDKETAQRIMCSDTSDNILTDELYIGLFSTELELAKHFNGGCFEGFDFTNGDTIKYSVYVRLLHGALPTKLRAIPSLSAGFSFFSGSEELMCSKSQFPFKVLKAQNTVALKKSEDFEDCTNVTVGVNIRQGGPGAVDYDPFPNEIRPISKLDSLLIKLPKGIGYVAHSSKTFYTYEAMDSSIQTAISSINDPEVYQADSSIYLKYRNTNYPIVDFVTGLTRNELTFEVSPDCRVDNDIPIEATVFYELYSYPSDLPEPQKKKLTKNQKVKNITSRRKLSVSSQNFLKNSDKVFWDIEVCNEKNDDTTLLPYNWIAGEVIGQNINLISLSDITDSANPIPLPLEGYGNGGNKWGKIGNLEGSSCRKFRLTADYLDCKLDSLFIKTGFDCASYPTDPITGYLTPEPIGDFPEFYSCEENQEEESVLLFPRNPEFQFELQEQPTNLSNLCQPLIYELRILNTQTGPGFDLKVEIELPPGDGMSIISGSSEIKYPSPDPFRISPDPMNIPGTNNYVWDLSLFDPIFSSQGLSSTFDAPLNEFIIRFQLNTTCDFEPSLSPVIIVTGNGVCAGDVVSSPFSLPLLNFDGFSPDNNYQLDLITDKINPCLERSTMTVEVSNTGSRPTVPGQTIQLIIPDELEYIPGSISGVRNFPNNVDPTISLFNNTRILRWQMPTSISPSDFLSFNVDFSGTDMDKISCGLAEATLQTTQEISVPCTDAPQGRCLIDVINIKANFKLEIDYPDPMLSNVTATSIHANDSMETVTVFYEISNQSNDLTFDSVSMIQIFADTDGDTQFDELTDKFLDKFSTPNLDIAPLGSINTSATVLLPSKELCGIFLVMNESENACICSSDTVYIPMIPIENAVPDDTICLGKSINLGQSPIIGFQYEWQPAGFFPTNISNPNFTFDGSLPVDNQITQTFVLTTTRAAGCSVTDSVSITTYQNPGMLEVSNYNGSQISCFGADDAFITASVDALLPISDTLWNTGQTTAIIDNLSPGNYSVTFTDIIGCKTEKNILIIEPPAIENNLIQSDFLGFGIKCYGEDSGFAEANVFGGTGGYRYDWSIGSDSISVQNLIAGTYSVTVYDANDCSVEKTFELTEPEPISADAETLEVSCFGDDDGVIEVIDILPTGRYTFSIDCQDYTSSSLFSNLSEGDYTICIQDERGCVEEEIFSIISPPELYLEVSGDTSIYVGSSVNLFVSPSHPINQLLWEPPFGLSCTDCPNPIATPDITQNYRVSATDVDGCKATARVTVAVNKNGRIYIPTAFSPNNDGINDLIQMYVGFEVAKIKSFNIYSRWGEKVFEALDYDPKTTTVGWDGLHQGQPMNPNVFSYFVEAEIGDGSIILKKGEFKLIR